jgi:hypothetical protein
MVKNTCLLCLDSSARFRSSFPWQAGSFVNNFLFVVFENHPLVDFLPIEDLNVKAVGLHDSANIPLGRVVWTSRQRRTLQYGCRHNT